MNKLLILIPYYIPGYKSGGPQQTVKNLTDTFGDKADFYILTKNHDLNSEKLYENVKFNEWVNVGKAHVKYVSDNDFKGKELRKCYDEFDKIYSCGLFEINSIMLLLLHKKKRKKKQVYVAPMGVFSVGAIKSKTVKKMTFLKVFKMFGLFNNITWSFTSELEREDAVRLLGEKITRNYVIAEDLPRKIDYIGDGSRTYSCDEDSFRIVFLSRICSQKNLLSCADILNHDFSKKIVFDIYGVIEDKIYFEECKRKLDVLPKNIIVNYKGEVKPEEVINVFGNYDVFLFPTKGENFGHVIYEALVSGCLPVISDRTSWNDLEDNNCGYIVGLENPEGFSECIKELMSLNESQLGEKKTAARKYAARKYSNAVSDSGYRKIFE